MPVRWPSSSRRGEGVHHIAFLVDDIVAELARLKKEGFVLLNEVPKKGADNKWVAFVHPKSSNGVLVELCQEESNSTKPLKLLWLCKISGNIAASKPNSYLVFWNLVFGIFCFCELVL